MTRFLLTWKSVFAISHLTMTTFSESYYGIRLILTNLMVTLTPDFRTGRMTEIRLIPKSWDTSVTEMIGDF